MNLVVLIGRLVADPELRFAASTGKAVTNFRIAVNRRFAKDNKTDFFRVVVWGKQAEAVAKYLKKGAQCAVNGSIQVEQYTDENGNNRYSTEIVANQVDFLGSTSTKNTVTKTRSINNNEITENFDGLGIEDKNTSKVIRNKKQGN